MSINFLLATAALSLLLQLLFFIIAASFKTDKVTDLAYGLSFVVLAWFGLLDGAQAFRTPSWSSYQLLATLAVTIWGFRLAIYLFIRILKIKRDTRFDQIRNNFWQFARFWLLQAISVWVISLPISYTLSLQQAQPLTAMMILGLVIWLLGLVIETIADWQKFRFKNRVESQGLWVDSGLWRYSRHPNYLGEILCWWGLFIFTLPVQSGWSYLTIIGPIFITGLLLFVTGIPPLEKRYEQRYGDNEDYQQYKQNTSLLVPFLF